MGLPVSRFYMKASHSPMDIKVVGPALYHALERLFVHLKKCLKIPLDGLERAGLPALFDTEDSMFKDPAKLFWRLRTDSCHNPKSFSG